LAHATQLYDNSITL